jgi:Protein of unknown function (DUF1549)/Protein of unknown function (DUF1553)/Bacterial Ig-like domain (group 2)
VFSTSLRFASAFAVSLLAFHTVHAEAPIQPATIASPSFVNDVVPLLTRLGCNQGSCHGKAAGQNGFRLSLRGYAPELDYKYLTRELDGRRLSPSSPEDSLLLRKPLGLAAHEGGKLFNEDSREYQVLLAWIRGGAPGPNNNDPELKKIEVLPRARTLRPEETQPLQVIGEYSDGSRRDVTWLCKFDSNDNGMAEVDAHGKVTVRRHGETSIRVRFMSQVAVVVVTAPFEQKIDPARLVQRNNFIDEHVCNKLAALRIEPSDLCTDAEFIRRAFLDAIGLLPTPSEVRAFLNDPRADKRAKLIDALLERPEFVDHWALFLGDLLQNRKERDHDVRGTKGVRDFHDWLRKQVAANRPWDELARDVLTASGTTTDNPAVGYYVVTVGEQREAHRSEVVASAAQAFLGTRIGCAQCHNHPLERYTQDDYYHFSAYFSRVKLERKDPKTGPTTLRSAGPDGKPSKAPVGVTQPRTGQFMKPQPLDRSETAVAPDEDPRVSLAAWMTDPKNEYFSGAMVNRLWRQFLGAGLVEPVDDLRASNPPTNPELWRALNKEFVGHQYDMKHLMRLILNSRTYQWSAETRPGNQRDTRFYSHYYARRLPAEVLLDALSQSTGVPDEFPGYPVGLRAGQLPDPTLKSYFLTLFGRSERVTACACERNGEVTMPQLLHLQNGEAVVRKIRAGDGRLAKLLKEAKTDSEIVEELFLLTLSRPATATAKQAVQKELAEGGNREEVFRDLFWALLNAKEFAFNH